MNNILVFDFETGALNIDTLEVVEIACLAIDPISLKIVKGSEFNSLIRPIGPCELRPGYIEQGALNVNKKTLEELKTAPERKFVMSKFVEHVQRFGKGWKKPHAAGKNIRTFDIPILNRVLTEEKLNTNIFDNRRQFDIEDDLERFYGHDDYLPNMKMDTIREYFGMSTDNAHSSLVDCKQTAWLIAKFLKLYREFRKRVVFKDSAKLDGGILS